MLKIKWEFEDYCVAVYEHYDSAPKDWVEMWHGVWFIKAVWKYLRFRYKYPKHTIHFIHNRYY